MRAYDALMSMHYCAFPLMSDTEILAQAKKLAEHERHATAALIASLIEVEARKLYLKESHSSLFVYCREVLCLSEAATYTRTTAARAARKFPAILDLLGEGSITLTTVRLLAPHLNEQNWKPLLEEAEHKGKRAVQKIVARISPQPDVKTLLRKLPTPRREMLTPTVAAANDHSSPPQEGRSAESVTSEPTVERGIVDVAPALFSEPTSKHDPGSLTCQASVPTTSPVVVPLEPPKRPTLLVPLSPGRYKLQMTISEETQEKLARVQELIRHSVPDGDPAVIFDRALTLLLKELERTQFAQVTRPRKELGTATREPHSSSRHIPATVKRAVVARDKGQCSYVGKDGKRCGERNFLQFHHAVPFAVGGPPTVSNIFMRCAAHNRDEAVDYFGATAERWRSKESATGKGTGSGTGWCR